jgi:ElaB/YqjD/DUF883 family membrane-anchored ribosome-binding protein
MNTETNQQKVQPTGTSAGVESPSSLGKGTEPVTELPVEEIHGIFEAIKEKASTLMHSVTEAAEHLKENVVEQAHKSVVQLETAAEDMTEKVKETVTETFVSAKDKVIEVLHWAPTEAPKEEEFVEIGVVQLTQEKILQEQAISGIPLVPPAPADEIFYDITLSSNIPAPLSQGVKSAPVSLGELPSGIEEELPPMQVQEEYTLGPISKAETLEDIVGVVETLKLKSGEVKVGESLMIPSYVEPSDEQGWTEVKTYHQALHEMKSLLDKQGEQNEQTHALVQQHADERQKQLDNNPMHPFDLSLLPKTDHVWPTGELTISSEVAWQNPEKTQDIVNTLLS